MGSIPIPAPRMLAEPIVSAAVPEEDAALVARGRAVWDEASAWRSAAGEHRDSYRAARDGVLGRHFEATVVGPDGRILTQKQYLERLGRKATAFNLIEPIVRQMVGQFRQNVSARDVYPETQADEQTVRMMNVARRRMRDENASDELEADAYLTFVTGGRVMFRSEIERAATGPFPQVVRDHSVHTLRGFYNLDVADVRMRDLRIVGEIVDLTPEVLVHRFARSKSDGERILSLYGLDGDALLTTGQRLYTGFSASSKRGAGRFYADTHDVLAFGATTRDGMLRLVPVWVQEYDWQTLAFDPLAGDPDAQAMGMVAIPEGEGPLPPALQDPEVLAAVNLARADMGAPPVEVRKPEYLPVWRYYFLAPDGGVVRHGTSAYWHGGHPYTVGHALALDGEVWGAVASLLEPQQWFNARMSDLDHATRTAVRSTLLINKAVRENSGLTATQLAEALTRGDASVEIDLGDKQWSEVVHEVKPGSMPTGAMDMVAMLPGLLERMSGVSEAAQGVTPKSGTTATQYERQVIQSGVLQHVYQDRYYETLARKDRDEVRLLQQVLESPAAFHDVKTGEVVAYDPARARAARFAVSMGAAADTPTQRLADEQMLREDVLNGFISPDTYYANSGRPNAATLAAARRAEQLAAVQAELAALGPPGAPAGGPASPSGSSLPPM